MENLRYCLVRHSFRELADFLDLFAREFRISIRLAARGIAPFEPAPFEAVVHVVEVRPEVEVLWVHAWRVVAVMEDMETARDCPLVDLPREPVGALVNVFAGPLARDNPVSVSVRSSHPDPAPARFNRDVFFVETFLEWAVGHLETPEAVGGLWGERYVLYRPMSIRFISLD